MACVVLHNIAISCRSPEPGSEPDHADDGDEERVTFPAQEEAQSGRLARQYFVQRYFST